MPSGLRPFYWFVRALLQFVFCVVFHTRIVGRDRVPPEGGLLVVSNHISWADPPMLAVAIPRRVDFMAMVEIFRKPVLGVLARGLGAFPVDRDNHDRRAVREVVRRLQAGRCVAMFPEAGIRLTEKSVLGGDPVLKTGPGMIALLSRSAILPVIVRDTRKPYNWRNWLPIHGGKPGRATMSVTIGRPFCLWVPDSAARTEQRRHATDTLRERLLKTVELG